MEKSEKITIWILAIIMTVLIIYSVYADLTTKKASLLLAGILICAGVIIYLILKNLRQKQDIIDDVRQFKAYCRDLVTRHDVRGYYNVDGELVAHGVTQVDKRQFTNKNTKDMFGMMELEIADSENMSINFKPGLATNMMHMNHPETKIMEFKGTYGHFDGQAMNHFIKHNSMFRKMPLTTPESDQLNTALALTEGGYDIDPSKMLNTGTGVDARNTQRENRMYSDDELSSDDDDAQPQQAYKKPYRKK